METPKEVLESLERLKQFLVPFSYSSKPYKWEVYPSKVAHAVERFAQDQDQDSMIDAARARTRALALEQAAATKALFAQWQVEDATGDPEELKRRDTEMLELQHALNENRKATGERLPFPDLETRV